MLTIPPIICLLCGGDIGVNQTLLEYGCYVGVIFINASKPSYNMPAMWGNSSMAIKPSYNMPIMRGRYLSMPTNPPIICLLCGGIDQWQVFPPIICLL